MEKMNDLFDYKIDLVCNNYSSIFTKDDVIELLSKLRTEVLNEALELKRPIVSISEMDFQQFSADVVSRLDKSLSNGNIDVYDYSSAEFSIGYNNELSIESINIDNDCITEELSNILLDAFQLSFGEFITSGTE